jgi:hypothetical protein
MSRKEGLAPHSASREKNRHQERRGKLRFPLRQELRYKVLREGGTLEVGAGQTCSISSAGVVFSTDRNLAPGAFVQLFISWPALLDGNCLMRFIVFGRVLDCGDGHCACTIDRHEFRTQARGADAASPPRDFKLERWADTIRREELKARFAVV